MVISQRLLSDDAVRDVQEVAVALQWAEMTLAVFGGEPDEGEVTEEWPGKDLQALSPSSREHTHRYLCAKGRRARSASPAAGLGCAPYWPRHRPRGSAADLGSAFADATSFRSARSETTMKIACRCRL